MNTEAFVKAVKACPLSREGYVVGKRHGRKVAVIPEYVLEDAYTVQRLANKSTARRLAGFVRRSELIEP